MKKLLSTFSTIQAVLEDAELKQMQDRAIQDWLQKLKDATYKLDDCSTEARRWESEGQSSGYLKKVSTSLLYPFENIKFRHKIGKRINKIKERSELMAEERTKFHLREVVVDKQVELAQSHETSSFLSQPKLCRRDEDKEKIIKDLAEDVCESKDVSVYPIIGIGGLEKTTLTQIVIHDERVKRHFEPKI